MAKLLKKDSLFINVEKLSQNVKNAKIHIIQITLKNPKIGLRDTQLHTTCIQLS